MHPKSTPVFRVKFNLASAYCLPSRPVISGASFAAVSQKLKDIPKGKKILTFSYDTGERYLSIEGLF
jgi:hypothetical protein